MAWWFGRGKASYFEAGGGDKKESEGAILEECILSPFHLYFHPTSGEGKILWALPMFSIQFFIPSHFHFHIQTIKNVFTPLFIPSPPFFTHSKQSKSESSTARETDEEA